MIERRHLISGLVVESEIPLAGVPEAEWTGEEPDVKVRRGQVPHFLHGTLTSGPNWCFSGDKFLFSVPRVARIQVNSGREIVAECEGPEADAVPFLLGTAFGVLLHQRNSLILHASAVSHHGRAIALCGPSGVGKSTLSAALCESGCGFLSDDVSSISFENAQARVFPDSRQHRLWHDSIEKLSLAERKGEAVRESIEKYHVEPACKGDAMPLAKIIVLRKSEFPKTSPVIEPLGLSDAAALLRADVYRSRLAASMGRNEALFSQIARLLSQVKVYRLIRPLESARLEEVVELLQQNVFAGN